MLITFISALVIGWAKRDPFNIDLNCERAFEHFMHIYKKSYDTPIDKHIAEQNFCVHLKYLRELRNNKYKDVTFGITSRMDQHPTHGIAHSADTNMNSHDSNRSVAAKPNCTWANITNKYTNCTATTYSVGPDLKDGSTNTTATGADDTNKYKKMDEFYLVDVRDMNVQGRQRTLPNSVDLREVGFVTPAKDQGFCGSCYEFAAIEVLENLMLVDADIYKEGKYLDPEPFPTKYFMNCSNSQSSASTNNSSCINGEITVSNRTKKVYTNQPENWKSFTAANLKLSVQFLLDNLIGGHYCNGGNYFNAISDFVNKLSKLAKESECIYREYATSEKARPDDKSKCDNTKIPDFNPAHVSMPMKKKTSKTTEAKAEADAQTDYVYDTNNTSSSGSYGVYQILRNEGLSASSGGSMLSDNIDKGKFSEWERKVMNVLARGVALAAAMHTESGVNPTVDGDKYEAITTAAKAFNLYKGGVVPDVKCIRATTNHQVLLVGYGTFKGRPIWIMRNSWGTGWGVSGYYYIGRGTNTLCHELTVEYTMPRFYGPDRDGVHPFFIHAANRTQDQNATLAETIRLSPFSNKVKRCVNGIDTTDPYGGTLCETIQISIWNYVIVGILAIIVFFLGRYCMQYYFCAPEYIFHTPIALKLAEIHKDPV